MDGEREIEMMEEATPWTTPPEGVDSRAIPALVGFPDEVLPASSFHVHPFYQEDEHPSFRCGTGRLGIT